MKKIRKPREFKFRNIKSVAMGINSIQDLSFIVDRRNYVSYKNLNDFKRLYDWLGKAIKYLEQK